jgi:hypothetical protein
MQGIAPGSPRQDVCKDRNLLDFNDITMDGRGRVLVAYTDGCVDKCVGDPKQPSTASQDMVLRQSGGLGLLAAFDGQLGEQFVASATSGPLNQPGSGASPTPASGVAAAQTLPNTAAAGSDRVPLLLLPAGIGAVALLRRRRLRAGPR